LITLQNLTYWGTGKNRYQMEVPDNAVKNVPNEYEVTSQKKGSRRYRTPEIERLLSVLSDAEDRRDNAQKDTMRRIFSQFDKQ
jgi:DNA mismatch repair protein MSH6